MKKVVFDEIAEDVLFSFGIGFVLSSVVFTMMKVIWWVGGMLFAMPDLGIDMLIWLVVFVVMSVFGFIALRR